jgi:Holliday junction resolvase RusA-like endonuclease
MNDALFQLDPDPAIAGVLRFSVRGIAKTAGSKKFVGLIKHGPRAGRAILTDDSGEKGRLWRASVQQAAVEVFKGELIESAVRVRCDFYFIRPRSHYGSGRNEGVLRSSAPAHHLVKPDGTKLWRAVEDALTGIIWRDDSIVVSQLVNKHYGPENRVDIAIELLTKRTVA